MASSPLSVLVVDDDAGITAMLSAALDDEGFTVRTAANGAEALELVERARPDVILLDMRMPVMSGWEFARRLRERPGQQPVIIVMTAAFDPRQWAGEAGADGHLDKPFDLDELFAMLARYASVGKQNAV